jgi:AcrR family transcriptional regulator
MTERPDPRIARTDRALESAILELAARRPVSGITVADLTEAAGVSRATFYNRHNSPLELLIGVLDADLDRCHEREEQWRAQTPATPTAPKSSPEEALRLTTGDVIDHVARFADVYRQAIDDPADRGVYAALVQDFADYALEFMTLSTNPGIPAANRQIAAQFLAHGFAGAIAAWLRDQELTRDDLLDAVVACAPAWWRR